MRSVLIGALFTIAAVGFIYGFEMSSKAVSAVHEIEALICFLIGAVGLGCGTVALTIEASRQPPKPPAAPAASS